MTVSDELCCVALLFCCFVVVALLFSASLEMMVNCTCTLYNVSHDPIHLAPKI